MIKRLVIIFLIFLTGCSKEIEINLETTKALVLNSVFNSNDFLTFRISTTASLLNNYDSLNENLHFSLYEGDWLLIDSIFQANILETNLTPIPGKKYSVEVKSENFPSIKATDTIPNLVLIDNAYMIFPVGVDEFGSHKAEACISFSDPVNESNYYELLIHYRTIIRNDWNTDYETIDPVLLNEGDQNYRPTSFFFSDELFNGESYTMRIKNVVGSQIQNNIIKPPRLYATLRSVSRAYYKYRKYYTRHVYNQQFQNEFLDLIFKGEPQNMYNNIENGYGIFAGYCETTRQIIHNE